MADPTKEPKTRGGGRTDRKVKNFLLDARFQLKFAGYIVVLTLIVAGMLGAFLGYTTSTLFAQAQLAVDARSKTAETSKELGTCTLNNDLAKNLDNPDFDKQLTERSNAIDKAYEAEKAAVIEAKSQLVTQQKVTLIALVGGLLMFVAFIGLASIVTTHRIVGPLFRVKRMANEVSGGKLRPPQYGLRPGDELKDVFEAFSAMVGSLRARQEADLKAIAAVIAAAKEKGQDTTLLEKLRAELQARLDA
jgi:nitrogen fixation/metabolism regulation signal transduction histidine kinase